MRCSNGSLVMHVVPIIATMLMIPACAGAFKTDLWTCDCMCRKSPFTSRLSRASASYFLRYNSRQHALMTHSNPPGTMMTLNLPLCLHGSAISVSHDL